MADNNIKIAHIFENFSTKNLIQGSSVNQILDLQPEKYGWRDRLKRFSQRSMVCAAGGYLLSHDIMETSETLNESIVAADNCMPLREIGQADDTTGGSGLNH